MTFRPPQLILPQHDCASFACGNSELDNWLRQRAQKNQLSGASRTYVVGDADQRVAAYYCLSTGAIETQEAPGSIRRNMPNPIPVTLLGRLAIDGEYQGKGLGRALLKDAIGKTQKVAEIVGVRALLVNAIDESAVQFYLHTGFKPSPINRFILMLPVAQLSK